MISMRKSVDFVKKSDILEENGRNRVKEVSRKRMWYLPIASRLQRLYASPGTTSNMRWHAENVQEEGVLIHPSDAEAWKHFDRTYPSFAEETRNVRLGLCSDGFSPFNISGKPLCIYLLLVQFFGDPLTCLA
jgi:hypothetical protein